MANFNMLQGKVIALALMKVLEIDHPRVQSVSIDTPTDGPVVANIRVLMTMEDMRRVLEVLGEGKIDG